MANFISDNASNLNSNLQQLYKKSRSNTFTVNDDHGNNIHFLSETKFDKIKVNQEEDELLIPSNIEKKLTFVDLNLKKLPSFSKQLSFNEFENSIIYLARYNFIQMYTSLSNNKCPTIFFDQLKIIVESYKTEFTLTNLFGYTVYFISGFNSSNEQFKINRRYSDFMEFNRRLQLSFPGLIIPPIPPKQYLGNMEEGFVRLRMKYLQQFFIRLCESPHLLNNKLTILFLDENVQDFTEIPFEVFSRKPEEILAFYKDYFFFLKDRELDKQKVFSVNEFYGFLENVRKSIKSYRLLTTESRNIQSDFKRETENFYESFYDFDNDILGEIFQLDKTTKIPFNEDILESKMSEVVHDTKFDNCFNSLYYWVQQEKIDTIAMLDALQCIFTYKQNFETLLNQLKIENEKLYTMNNPGIINSFFFSKDLNLIESQIYKIQKLTEEITIIKELIEWMYKIAYYFEIPLFKENRLKFYEIFTKTVSEIENGSKAKTETINNLIHNHCNKILKAFDSKSKK